jgi:hypothetical protein
MGLYRRLHPYDEDAPIPYVLTEDAKRLLARYTRCPCKRCRCKARMQRPGLCASCERFCTGRK